MSGDLNLASCGHPADDDGECGCAYWPERAPLPPDPDPPVSDRFDWPDEDEPEPEGYDPGDAVDDEGGWTDWQNAILPDEPLDPS